MKRMVVFLLLFISVLTLSANDTQNKDFLSKKLGVSLSVPKDWGIEESKCDPLVSLYSPETKQHPNKTLDLEKGIKMELADIDENTFKEMLRVTKSEKFAELANVKGKEYVIIYKERGVYEKKAIILLHALVKDKNACVWVVGYIPEENKVEEYSEKYILILSSINFI